MNELDKLYKNLKGKLIVSCQALPGEPLYVEEDTVMPLMAKAAMEAGAAGIRANSIRDVIKIKEAINLPVIGLIKKQYEGYPQHITVTMEEINQLMKAKTDIIALDCTLRDRVDGKTINEFIKEIKNKYPEAVLMADVSTLEEGINAWKAGVEFVGTTLSGYTPYSKQVEGPDFDLVNSLAKKVTIPVIAEGRIHSPEQAKRMLEIGAYAVVVGGAITRPLEITKRFVNAMCN